MKKLSKIYPGWWMVFATGIVGLLGAGFVKMAFSVIFKPISGELGFSRAITSIASSIMNAVGASMFLVAGFSSDKYGPRRVMMIGVIIAAAGCFMMYFVNSLWSFLIVWGVIVSTGTQLGFTFLTDRAIVNWFVKKSGMAVNIKFAIQSLAGVVLLPLVAWLITTQGWRNTYIIAGAVFLVIGFPLVWNFVKPQRPEYYGLLPDGESSVEKTVPEVSRIVDVTMDEASPEFTLKQTLRTSSYWLYFAMLCASLFAMPMMEVHLVPFLTDMDIGPVQAASMMGMMNVISIPTRLVVGYAIDRVKTTHLRFFITLGMASQFAGVISFLIFKNAFSVYLWLVLYGIGYGAIQSINFPLMARFFGRKSCGSITGLLGALTVPFSVLLPIYAGWVYDSTSTYLSYIVVLAVLSSVAVVISLFLIPPKAPLSQSADLLHGS